jgi:hypothetical protein
MREKALKTPREKALNRVENLGCEKESPSREKLAFCFTGYGYQGANTKS